MTTMTITDNKQLAVEWLELVSGGDVDEMCLRTSPSWTMEGGPFGLPTGHEGLRALFASFGNIDQEWSIEDVIAEDDKVVIRATNRCVQDSFFDVPGRGVEQVFTATFILQIVDGLVVRTWRNAADLQRLLQLGARILPPAPPRPSMP
jgi:predicted ester cyclase